MKRTIILLISVLFILAACSNGNQDDRKDKSADHPNSANQIATDKDVQGDNYRTLLPFKESKARGILQDNMTNGYNGEDFERGLLNLSKDVFSTDKYLYQDGQYLSKSTINAYLEPKFTKDEIDKMSESEQKDKNANENLGLNPSHHGETDKAKIAKKSPAYLSNILEQDFYGNRDKKGSNIKGMTIGLAMNSVYYYQKEKDGETYSENLDDKEIEKQGKSMASEILSRLRANEDLKDIPIHFAIYKQSGQDSISPGSFIAQTTADDGQTTINHWKSINEKTVLL
ncbi:MAG: CamS family sex pheromone protein, partial [Staphylococcus lugdunensis]|nr:CamS family sex pheromone protein [Staphylococcus lugdunensis]